MATKATKRPREPSVPVQEGHGQGLKHKRPTPLATSITPSTLPAHTFAVEDPRDHAETPFEAYSHLEPLLYRLALALGKTKADLRIYDPYFCAGSMKEHLGKLGFTSVYNRNEDCYSAWKAGSVPEFDVLVTNPPFSGDHIPKALAYAVQCGKPWFMLIPEFCARKSYYRPTLGIVDPPKQGGGSGGGGGGGAVPPVPVGPVVSPHCGQIHYLGPRQAAYMFSAPSRDISGKPLVGGGATGAPSSGSSSAPRVAHLFAATFQCVWFMSLGTSLGPPILKWWGKKHGGMGGNGGGGGGPCVVAESETALPQLALDPGKKRREEAAAVKRPWRKKLLRQRQAERKAVAAAAAGGGGGGGGGK